MKKKAILAIDGGGVRGILPIIILSYLEKKLQELSGNTSTRLADYFDLVAGTSTGGIITAALLTPDENNRPKYSAEDIIKLYLEESKTIFHASLLHEVKTASGFMGVKYNSVGLEKVMTRYFGDAQLKHLLKPCLITAFDITNNKNHLFRQHRAKQEEKYNYLIKDATRACASPMGYFPPVHIKSSDGNEHCFIDGGIFATNPALSAYAEIKHLHPGIESKETLMLSLGTGKQQKQFSCNDTQNWGVLEWLNPANHIMITALAEAPDGQLENIYNYGPQYCRINPNIDEKNISGIDNFEESYFDFLMALGEKTIEEKRLQLDEFAQQLYLNGTSPINVPVSLTQLLDNAADQRPDNVGYIGFDTALDYQSLRRYALKFSKHLMSLKDTGTVAIMLPNILPFPVCLFGTWYSDKTATLINPLFTSDELLKQCIDSGATTIIIAKPFLKTLKPILKETKIKHIITVDIGDMQSALKGNIINMVSFFKRPSWVSINNYQIDKFEEILNQPDATDYRQPAINNEIALLQYTGGTSGELKAAILKHENILANVNQLKSWLPSDLNDQSKILTALPLYHIFALTINCLVFMHLKGTSILVVNPRELKQMINPLKKYAIDVITGVNTLFHAVALHKEFLNIDWSHLKVAVAGGMPLQESTAMEWYQGTHNHIVQGYGLTECSPVACAEPYGTKSYSGSVGQALPQTDIAIIDKEHQRLPQGEVGEICIKGPQVMGAYWHKPELNKEVFTDEGHFRTGDLGYLDEQGRLFIVGRLKELILVSGFNVYPNDVEQVLNKHPAVIESACIGVEDEHSGQVVKAYLVQQKGIPATEEELIDYCHEHLAHYKVPKHFEWIPALPKSHVGKILKRLL